MTRLQYLILLFCLIALWGCDRQVAVEALHTGSSVEKESNVVVIWSTPNALYEEPTQALAEKLQDDALVWKAQLPANRRPMRHAIQAKSPDLIVTLGTRAALFARSEFPDVPTLFAMVVDYQRHESLTGSNVMGIALEVPPHHEFTQFKIVIPTMERVVAFHTDETSPALLEASGTALEELGIELVAHRVDDAADIPHEFASATVNADAVWLFNDPALMTSGTFDFLRRATRIHQLPFLCSLSRRFAEHGALMSVSVNLGSLGFQAASMARSFLKADTRPSVLGVQPPIGTEFVVNLETSDAIGLAIPPETFFVADEILHLETDQLGSAPKALLTPVRQEREAKGRVRRAGQEMR